ncbi:accessory gene regulator B family protein [Erysipelothrix rhusiopathiae]|nr:accessory gene regulator B family protein [Erysipelothrix rhusiopathiae]
MKKISFKLSHNFYKYGYIDEDDCDRMRFALEVVMSNLFTFGFIILTGIVFHCFRPTLAFVVMLGALRSLDDTFHSNTFFGCFTMTVFAYVFSVFGPGVIDTSFKVPYMLLSSAFCGSIMLVFLFNRNNIRLNKNSGFMSYIIIMCIILFILTLALPSIFDIILVVMNVIMVVTVTFALGQIIHLRES